MTEDLAYNTHNINDINSHTRNHNSKTIMVTIVVTCSNLSAKRYSKHMQAYGLQNAGTQNSGKPFSPLCYESASFFASALPGTVPVRTDWPTELGTEMHALWASAAEE